MRNQRTIKSPVSLKGVGLHSGQEVNLTLRPAEVGTGVLFVRVDLAGRPRCLVAGLPGALPGLAERRLAAKKGLGNWRGAG